MKSILRFLLCFIISAVLVLLCGFGWFTESLTEAKAVWSFIGFSFLAAVIEFLCLEAWLNCKRKLKDLSEKIERLEEKLSENNKE